MRRTLEVPRDVPPKLERFLVANVPGLTTERARALLEQGLVRVNGKVAKATRRLWGGETVELDVPEAKAVKKVSGPPVPVLFENAQVLVVNKPAGVTVEPEPNQVSLVELVASQYSGFDVDGAQAPGVVHRLDKPTSGCLMFARSDDARAALERAFDEKRVTKTYLALVVGEPPERATLDTPFGKDPLDHRRYSSKVQSPRRARLHFTRLQSAGGVSLLEVDLDTGRTHQIRVQLQDAGYPVLGDPVYGTKETREHPAAVRLGRLALHAWRLAVEGQGVRVEAPLPEDYLAALAVAGLTPPPAQPPQP